jgi:GWxTD domain-containing protein
MNSLEHFVASPLAHAIGLAILHSIWESAVLAALLGFVLLAFRSARIRYVAGCAATASAVFAFAITLLHFLPVGIGSSPGFKPTIFTWNLPGGGAGGGPWYSNLDGLVPWCAPMWFAGVLLIYLRALGGCLFVQKLRRHGVCAVPEAWETELARLAARLRVKRSVQVLQSSLAAFPMVLGHFRPIILIPASVLSGFSPAQIETILLHELAHIRRHDYLVNIFQRLVEGLLFYHPAIWWISSVVRAERENCCDDMVVSLTGDAHEYALTLGALEQSRFSDRVNAVAITGGSLMKRIHRLLYPERQNSTWAAFLAAAVLLTAGAISLNAWGSKAPIESQAADHAQIQSDRYAKWLSEDVVYIIDDAERGTFQSLTSDAERDKFIEQFWERRNPTAGAANNAFKTEHYRRIAYANQHFRMASGTAGWQTDRGHMYIVYGAPDEIDSHPKENQKPALEYWSYRHIEGVGDQVSFTFVDRTGRGDYRLAP